MATTERVRESLSTPLTPEYLRQKARDGWRAVAIEWERGGDQDASASRLPAAEIPFGLRISDDGRHLIAFQSGFLHQFVDHCTFVSAPQVDVGHAEFLHASSYRLRFAGRDNCRLNTGIDEHAQTQTIVRVKYF